MAFDAKVKTLFKKVTALVATLAIVVALTACGSGSAESKDEPDLTNKIRIEYAYDNSDSVLNVIEMTNAKRCSDGGIDGYEFDKPCIIEIGGYRFGPYVIWYGPEQQ